MSYCKIMCTGLLLTTLLSADALSEPTVSCQEIIGITDAVKSINANELLYRTGDKQNKVVDQAMDMVTFILEAMEANPACEVSLEKQLEESQNALYVLSI